MGFLIYKYQFIPTVLIVFICSLSQQVLFAQSASSIYLSHGDDDYKMLSNAALQANQKKKASIKFDKNNYEIRLVKALAEFDSVMEGKKDHNTPWGKQGVAYNVAMDFENMDSIVIDGQGASFNYFGLIQPFSFKHCKNIVLKNFSIDVGGRLPYSIGLITKDVGDSIELDIFNEYPIQGNEPVWCYVDYDPVTRLMTDLWSYGGVSRYEKIGKQKVRFIKGLRMGETKVGRWLIVQHIGVYRPAFHFLDCENVKLENITLHSAIGMGVIMHRTKDILLDNIQVKPKQGRKRSINRDATHFISCMGNLTVKNSLFEAMGDDALNVHGFYYEVTKKVNDRTLILKVAKETQDWEMEYPHAGDEMEYVKKETLMPYASLKVKNVTVDKIKEEVTVEFTTALPPTFQLSDWLANATQLPTLTFVNNTVKDDCARGVLVQTRGALVENNVFDHCSGTGIDINTAANWAESIGTRDVVIRNNKFIACGNNLGTARTCTGITIRTETKQGAIGVHKNITIEGNDITGIGDKRVGIHVSSADHVLIKNNRIHNVGIAIRMVDAANVVIEGNNLKASDIEIGSGCNNKTITIKE